MRKTLPLVATLPLLLAACDPTMTASGPSGSVGALPEGVTEIAAPYQDLSTARIDEASGCYVYLHQGPVEATYLPLRARNGQPICAREPIYAQATG